MTFTVLPSISTVVNVSILSFPTVTLNTALTVMLGLALAGYSVKAKND